jgi:NTP pyrophosphatase (non-canonical NTP hydrolase)
MISDQLRDELLAFRKERDWEQFHNLRTLSTSIALEAAELMEHTQWAKDADLPELAAQHHEALAEEMADIAILLTYLAARSERGSGECGAGEVGEECQQVSG